MAEEPAAAFLSGIDSTQASVFPSGETTVSLNVRTWERASNKCSMPGFSPPRSSETSGRGRGCCESAKTITEHIKVKSAIARSNKRDGIAKLLQCGGGWN